MKVLGEISEDSSYEPSSESSDSSFESSDTDNEVEDTATATNTSALLLVVIVLWMLPQLIKASGHQSVLDRRYLDSLAMKDCAIRLLLRIWEKFGQVMCIPFFYV